MQAPSPTPSARGERSRSAASARDRDESEPRLRQQQRTPPPRAPTPRDSTPRDAARGPARSPSRPWLPSSPLPPLRVVPDVLPGTNLTYEQGLEVFKLPKTAFGVTPMNTIEYSRRLYSKLERVVHGENASLKRTHKGSFNAFFSFTDEQEEASILDDIGYTPAVRARIGFSKVGIGVRRGISARTEALDVDEDWDETFLAMIAALAGIGPRILAAGRTVDGRYVMLLERGDVDLRTRFTARWPVVETPTSYSSKLASLMGVTGQLRLVLADVKTANMIVIKGGAADGSEDRICFIDFDPKFAVVVESASAECVEFINMFLFTSFVYYRHKTRAMALVTAEIRERLENRLLQFQDTASARAQTFELSLCGILLTLARRDRKNHPSLLRLVRTDNRLLSRHILYVCGHYLLWTPFDENKNGQDSTSRIAPFDYTPNAPPIIEQIARRALDEFDVLDNASTGNN